ncbi:MAG: hypothetical protein KDA21_06530, partial [Phycisphaerales bacterium]|nr:hypothetical protein [Phycisphaerales bacterium]
MTDPATLHPEVENAVRELRGAIRTLLASVDADPRQPQEVHRRFALASGLCWKISRLERARNADEALNYLPGPEAFRGYLDALATGGADQRAIRWAQDAMHILSDNVRRYVGDKATLELVLDAAPGNREQLTKSRKLAFRGNSGIWGV